jgi:hypothetical protein
MKSWICLTLVDITATGITRGDSKERNQQRNWETVLQVLGLKTQPIILLQPEKIERLVIDDFWIEENYFGEFYKNATCIWGFKFTSESDDIYTLDNLYEDFEQVPVVSGLDETARFMLPIFHSYGVLKNIHFFPADELNIS